MKIAAQEGFERGWADGNTVYIVGKKGLLLSVVSVLATPMREPLPSTKLLLDT